MLCATLMKGVAPTKRLVSCALDPLQRRCRSTALFGMKAKEHSTYRRQFRGRCVFYAQCQAVRPDDSVLDWPALSLIKRGRVHQPAKARPAGLRDAQRRTG